MKKLGFTLAEVLITLVIIGVIAALTIGTVVSNTSKKQLEAKTKKFYTQFANAFEMYKVNNGIQEFSDDDILNVDDFAFNYLKVSSKCDENSKCFADEYSGRISGKMPFTINPWSSYKLDDGSSFTFPNNSSPFPQPVYFDVNGIDKPNKAGYDLWAATIHLDGRLDDFAITPSIRKSSSASEINDLVNSQFESYCTGVEYLGCFGYFIRNGFKIVD